MRATIVRAAFAMAVVGVVAATGGAPVSAASLPTLTFSAARAITSPQGGAITFQAKLSAASTGAVSVDYATADGTAVAGTDYDAASGTLQIPAGSTSGSVTVTLLPVAFGAGGSNKTFSLNLSNVSGATLAESSVAGTIHPDVFVTGSQLTFADVVINSSGTTAFLTVPAKNEVAVLSLKTGVYGKPIPVGSDPQGIDITADGKTLYVCDAGGQTISRVVIATRTVTTIITPSSFTHDTPASIAVMNDGHAIYTTTFAGSGFGGHAYNLDLSTGVSTLANGIGINGQTTEFSPVSRSADHSTVGVIIGDDSGGTFDIYTAATGNVVSNSLNTFISSSSLDGNGSSMLVDGAFVIDGASGAVLGTINDACFSSVLNGTGSTGYCLENQALAMLNVGRFLVSKTVSLPQPAAGGAQLGYSARGHVLVAETAGGATIIET